MKITRIQLRRIITEEMESLIKEEDYDCIRDCRGLGYSMRECRDQCRDSTSQKRHPLDVDGDGKLTISETKISRRQLERIISEELSSLSEASPGSQFSAAAERGAKSKQAQGKAEAEKELKKTLDWFELTVFPAIEDNQWPIVADEDYSFQSRGSGPEAWDDLRSYIPKGSKFTDLSSEVKFASWSPEVTYPVHLEQIYNQMENYVIKHNLNVPMTSAPGEVWSEEENPPATPRRTGEPGSDELLSSRLGMKETQ